jgi:hypothetical protein
MEYESADPSVVKSIKQRELLNHWLRAATRHRPLPLNSDFQMHHSGEELADMMGFDVAGEGDSARFVITQEGARLTATYGNDDVDPARRINRYLDDAIGPERYANVVPSYLACVRHKRPIYSVAVVQDADSKDVSYERLLLPFGSGSSVEQIIGSYKSISIDGGFKINNLMGLKPKAVHVIKIRAIIDRGFVPRASDRHASDEVIELN